MTAAPLPGQPGNRRRMAGVTGPPRCARRQSRRQHELVSQVAGMRLDPGDGGLRQPAQHDDGDSEGAADDPTRIWAVRFSRGWPPLSTRAWSLCKPATTGSTADQPVRVLTA